MSKRKRKVPESLRRCSNGCRAFPCVDHMAESGFELRGRRLVRIRITEKEQRQYYASLLPEQGCQSFE